jgi:hypothetical protein
MGRGDPLAPGLEDYPGEAACDESEGRTEGMKSSDERRPRLGVHAPLDINGEEDNPKKARAHDMRATPLSPDAPAPRTRAIVAEHGPGLSRAALEAWEQRVHGTPIVDLAYGMGLRIEDAKRLIKEVHAAIAEDLKENLNLNRQLDLDRIDHLLSTYYPQARDGNFKSANVVLKLLAHRAKLSGIEPLPDPGRSHPENILIWVQNALPSINKIVDALPPDS